MKIVYLHQYFVTRQEAGGARSYEFARRLIARGHEVTVITSPAMLGGRYTHVTETVLEGVPCVIIPVPYDNRMSYARRMLAFAAFALGASREAVRNRADVIVASSTPLTIALPALTAAFVHSTPMVFEVRDLWPDLPIAVGALRRRSLIAAARALEWLAYHRADRLIALSDGIADGMMRRGVPRERITVIPNAADRAFADADGAPVRERLGLAPTDRLIVYAGALGVMNDVGTLIDLAALLHRRGCGVHLLIMGAGRQHQDLLYRAARTGLLERTIHFWTPQPRRAIAEVYAAADLAATWFAPVPAMWATNSANKFFDALAAGVPVLVNDEGGWQARLLTETGAGLAAADIESQADQVVALLSDPPRLAAARRAAGHLARERFDREQLFDQFAAVVEAAAR